MLIEITGPIIIRQVKNLYNIIRIMPVLSWGISSSLVGMGFSYSVNPQIKWLDYVLILTLIVLIHGLIAHALNDHEDWISGTDQSSPGILSGGSRVIIKGRYNLRQLITVSKAALLVVMAIAVYFVWTAGPLFLVILAIGLWSALAYSCSPLRLAYHPLAGEWLCGFPAVFTCTAGTFYILTGYLNLMAVTAGAINAMLAIGLLMHHHISDIKSDLQAWPPKVTTVAWAARNLGIKSTVLIEVLYFLIALITGIGGGLILHPVFWISVPVAMCCIAAALNTDPENIMSITKNEYLLYSLIIGDAILKTALLFLTG